MSELSEAEIEQKVVEYLGTVEMTKNRNIATALGIEKHLVDKVITNLAKADRVEYLYLGTSYVKLKGK
jgi:hypothetical protein